MADEKLLEIYYKRLFPFNPMYKWLSYNPAKTTNFSNREFSFTLADDVYIRYQSFPDEEEWEKEVINKNPSKIDIGAIYNFRPRDHRQASAGSFQPQEKELVFDIDMTDYDEVRTCCSGADICAKCWKLMAVAVRVLDAALRDDFGFEHLLWVYSGRRGVHCWVADEVAIKMSSNARGAVAEYLQILKGGANQSKKISLNSMKIHPSITRSVKICERYFNKIVLDEQRLFGDNQTWEKILSYLPDDTKDREELKRETSKISDGHQRWSLLEDRAEEIQKRRPQTHIRDEVILHCLYPRLDINVSKGLNHLLKSPFCVHPKTGRVCVPFEAHRVDHFDPEKVPTVRELVEQCTKLESTTYDGPQGKRTKKDYKKTTLRASVDILENFVEKLTKSWKQKLIEESDSKMDF